MAKAILSGTLGLLSAICATGAWAANVTIDESKRHQVIQGFGTCVAGQSPGPKNTYLNEAFENAYMKDLGASILRMEINPDLGPKPLPPDTDYQTLYQSLDFSAGDNHGEGLLAQALNAHKLDRLLLYGTPWTPPGWMKANGVTHLLNYATAGTPNLQGTSPTATKDEHGGWHDPKNTLLPEQRANYGKYLAGFCQGFQKNFGLPIYGVSVQNELMFDEFYNSCRYDIDKSCINWSAKPLALVPNCGPKFSPSFHDTVQAIGQQFAAQKITAKILGPESVGPDNAYFSVIEEGYINAVISDPATAPSLGIINIHGYGGDAIHPADSRDAWAKFYSDVKGDNKEIWMTEESGEDNAWTTNQNGGKENGAISVGVHIDQALVYGNCNAYLYWQITDPKPSGGALTTPDPATGVNLDAKKYCAAKHFFRYIRPGAVRLDTNGDTDTFSAAAFVHDKNKTLTIVLINTATTPEPTTVTLPTSPALSSFQIWRTTATESFAAQSNVTAAGGKLSLTLPPQSMVTLYGQSARG